MPNAFNEPIVQIAAYIVDGGIGGPLLEAAIPPTVTTAGTPLLNDSVATEWVIRALLAFIVGGMLNLIVGFVKNEITKHRSE
jgi:hypothetical protein